MTESTAHEIADKAWGHSEPEPISWASGPWSLELRGDELAGIRYRGAIVLRSVRAVARDRNWNTVPAVVSDVTGVADGLRVSMRMNGLGAEIDAVLDLTTTTDQFSVALTARSLRDFESNRLGLTVLHPPAVAGEALDVISADGGAVRTAFPRAISPHQPALDIAELRWSAHGVSSRLRFSGEAFEMEDQRNWTDASFKTYSTPLARPFPVLVRAGTVVEQSVTLHCTGEPTPSRADVAAVVLESQGHPFPEITIGASTGPNPLPPRAPVVSALLVELDATTSSWPAALDRAIAEAAGRRLDVRVVARDGADVDAVLDRLGEVQLARLGVFSATSSVTEPVLWNALVAGVRDRPLEVELVGGARSHFTELNRRHADLAPEVPALTFSITPQMHATERAQLVESLSMQRLVARDATRIAGSRAVHIGPITLRPRYNAVATERTSGTSTESLENGYGAHLADGATDVRQRSRALAAWTIASASALAIPGVASLSYFETAGPRGIADASGAPFPVATAIGWLAELAGAPALVASGRPAGVWAVGARTALGPVVLAANLRSERVRFTLSGEGVSATIELDPFSIERWTPAATAEA